MRNEANLRGGRSAALDPDSRMNCALICAPVSPLLDNRQYRSRPAVGRLVPHEVITDDDRRLRGQFNGASLATANAETYYQCQLNRIRAGNYRFAGHCGSGGRRESARYKSRPNEHFINAMRSRRRPRFPGSVGWAPAVECVAQRWVRVVREEKETRRARSARTAHTKRRSNGADDDDDDDDTSCRWLTSREEMKLGSNYLLPKPRPTLISDIGLSRLRRALSSCVIETPDRSLASATPLITSPTQSSLSAAAPAQARLSSARIDD
uniref:Uncharacterized protein n=1 Tax=Plectus sambesii TaxID=2011161 RepID=A0A914URG6_9BILA